MMRISFWKIILIPSLGYFVDSYDLIIFNAVRIESLTSLGFSGKSLLNLGIEIANIQRIGLILGGLFWGVLGDKIGRQRVLFSSLFVFSCATYLNGFVTTEGMYKVLRFIAGFGLAAEFGAALTSITENLPKTNRSYAVACIAALGILGGAFASVIQMFSSWREAYWVGGIMGFLLLCTRLPFFYTYMQVPESSIYLEARLLKKVSFGNVLVFFLSFMRLKKILICTLMGLPIFFMASVLMAFGPEIAQSFFIPSFVSNADCILYSYLGSSVGDLLSGFIGQKLQSRKKTILLWIFFLISTFFASFFLYHVSVSFFYFWCFLIGLSSGYWVILMSSCGEQFGINFRSTATGIISNILRSSGILFTLIFQSLQNKIGILPACMSMASVCLLFLIGSWCFFQETFHNNVDFLEE